MGERFEIFADDGKWVVKDNEQLPHLLDLYKCCVRLNQQSQRIAELEEQLKNSVIPKFKIKQTVYSTLGFTEIFKGQIDVFDYYTQRYWVFFGDDIGCEWLYESELFKTKKEAQERLKNYEEL